MPTFYAKIGTFSGTIIVVKRVRDFKVGQKIEYSDVFQDCSGCYTGMVPRWHRGELSRIEGNRLFIDRL